MAMPNRMHRGYYPNNQPGQTPPIIDRGQINSGGIGHYPGLPGQGPPGQTPPIIPGQGRPEQAGYQGFGIGRMFQNLGNTFDAGSSIPTGGFGFSAGQQAGLAPLMQQLSQIAGGAGPNSPPLDFNSSGGALGALRSLGVNVSGAPHGGLGLSGDQQQQFLHSLQQFINGVNREGPPNRRPQAHPDPLYPQAGQIPYNVPVPPYGQLGHDANPGHRPPLIPPQAYSPGYGPHIPPRY